MTAEKPLSPRERDIVDLVALGMPDRHIAARLDLSYFTVKKRLHDVFVKLDLNNRLQVAKWRLSRGNE